MTFFCRPPAARMSRRSRASPLSRHPGNYWHVPGEGAGGRLRADSMLTARSLCFSYFLYRCEDGQTALGKAGAPDSMGVLSALLKQHYSLQGAPAPAVGQ